MPRRPSPISTKASVQTLDTRKQTICCSSRESGAAAVSVVIVSVVIRKEQCIWLPEDVHG
jgi:hypothetical protein